MLNKIAENIWIYDGITVSFYGIPFPTRMTVIRLSNGELWVHSPTQISTSLAEEILTLGDVKYLVSPNKLHHMFMQGWLEIFPDAKCYASPGLREKRKDIIFYRDLGSLAEAEWEKDIDQTIFKGSLVMEEVIFFHRSSKTLIVADLIENFNPAILKRWQRIVARLGGVLSPNGKTPADWRLSFMFGKKEAQQSLTVINDWDPDNIVISHGECIFGNGSEFIKRSFSWV